ncbi:MAG: hypothetical protein JWO47_882 [Candidatus Saccharibacteria bacterium]|nr:hypothetical protein [Candidatus Saccharibacteria bacterium]
MNERIPLTPEEASITAKRILSDADLIKGGADIAPSGTLRPADWQVENIFEKEIDEPRIKEFMNSTPEGHVITHKKNELHDFNMALHGAARHAVRLRKPGPLPKPSDFKRFMQANGIEVDFEELERESERRNEDYPYTEQLASIDYTAPLDEVTKELLEHPEYRLGKPVNVLNHSPDGNPGHLEDGWQIRDILANGKLLAAPVDGRDLSVPVTVGELDAWKQLIPPAQ